MAEENKPQGEQKPGEGQPPQKPEEAKPVSPAPAPAAAKPAAAKDKLKMRLPNDGKIFCWPDLVFEELVCLILMTLGFTLISIYFNAPLEQEAALQHTPNPSRAPWYFLGLQEMLVYFDPWIAGVMLPSLIIVGLMAVPYLDTNPKGIGYWCKVKERPFAFWIFTIGFILWFLLIAIGTKFRGPNWDWYWPWDDWSKPKINLSADGLNTAIKNYEKNLQGLDANVVKEAVAAAKNMRDELKIKGKVVIERKIVNRVAIVPFDKTIIVLDSSIPESKKAIFIAANRELKDRFTAQPELHNMSPVVGGAFLLIFFAVGYILPFFIAYNFVSELGPIRYNLMIILLLLMILMVVKIPMRLFWGIKYILYIPFLSQYNLRI